MFRTVSMFSALSALLLIGAANVGAHQNPTSKPTRKAAASSARRTTATPSATPATRTRTAFGAKDGIRNVHAAPGMPVNVDNGKTAPYDGPAATTKPAAKGSSTLKSGGKQ